MLVECIRGVYAGENQSYRVMGSSPSRQTPNTIDVTGNFFPMVLSLCEGWVEAHRDNGALADHIRHLPQWARKSKPSGKNAVQLAAALLSMSERSFYRRLADSKRPLVPTSADRDLVRGIRAKSAVDQWEADNYNASKKPSPADLWRAERDKKDPTLDDRLEAAHADWLKEIQRLRADRTA